MAAERLLLFESMDGIFDFRLANRLRKLMLSFEDVDRDEVHEMRYADVVILSFVCYVQTMN